MGRTPPIAPGLLLWDTYNGRFGMVTERYTHQTGQKAVSILWRDGEEANMFLDDLKNDGCGLDWAGRLKVSKTSRFANGKNYTWAAHYNDGEKVHTVSVLQSVRHDDPLAEASAQQRQLAAWKKLVGVEA